jgi:two-component SAPR family response regulator
MNGRALAEKLMPLRPEMAVIYMSGYSGFNPRGGHDFEANFISKPVTRKELIRKVDEVLSTQKEQEVI